MAFHNWDDALAVANGWAFITGRKHRVRRGRVDLIWYVDGTTT